MKFIISTLAFSLLGAAAFAADAKPGVPAAEKPSSIGYSDTPVRTHRSFPARSGRCMTSTVRAQEPWLLARRRGHRPTAI